jgi:hypothetical protein
MTDARAGMGKNFGPPMTLANMRKSGVHGFIARCEACGHAADVNVDALAKTIVVPEVGLRLRCGSCGGSRSETRHIPRDATAGVREFGPVRRRLSGISWARKPIRSAIRS